MAGYDIRVFGDPVLRQIASDVTNVDGALVKLTEDMIQTMYDAPGLGLAAPQIGVQKRLFVYDLHDGAGAKVLVNPIIKESRGEWSYDEGCLSIPDMSYEIVRPKEIHLTGYDLDGKEVSVEADELLARLYQHELDHLDGKLLLDYLDETQKAEAMRTLRNRMLAAEPKAKAKPQADAPKNKFGISLPGLK
jgi:peptide deformylase